MTTIVAALVLVNQSSCRIPIIDPGSGNVLYLLGQRALLRFLFQ